MTIPALRPCPFCGSAATLEDERLLWVARCTGCGACVLGDRAPDPEQEMPSAYWESFKQSAVDRWNRQAAPPTPDPETLAEALAARPLLEKVARLDNSTGITVAEVRQLAARAAAWLRENPPGPIPITLADRLALAVCRAIGYPGPCHPSQICNGCREQSAAVAHEIARQLRERHGGSSQVADWLDGVGCHPPETVQTVKEVQ
jgi:hypothetical protein